MTETYAVDDRVWYEGPLCQGPGTVTAVDDSGIEVTLDGGEETAPHVPGGRMFTSWRYLRPLADATGPPAA